jgi:FAD/FMN-containing dehydrogenase
MDALLAELTAIAGPEHVLTDPDLVVGYTTDWTRRFRGPARCVIRPADTGEVAAVLIACARHGAPVVPQGGNTGLVGGGVPGSEGAVVLSARRLRRLDPVDTLSGQVTAGAGVTIAELRTHAARAGLEYGVDLAARDSATVGGTIATNAGGIQTIRYGPTRAQLLGLEAVLAGGSVISRLGGIQADNTGYDLTQLLAGSEGTLGVITAARLRLWPAEPSTLTVLAGVPGIEAAAAVVAEIEAAGGSAVANTDDVSTWAGAEAIVASVVDSTGGPGSGHLDILVNNAGYGNAKTATEASNAEWNEIIEVDLNACFRLAKRASVGMIRRGWGRIINISSINAHIAREANANYCAAKAGLEGLTRALAVEWGPKGVTVNAIAPGYMMTPDNMETPLRADPETREWFAQRAALKRWGHADELDGAVVYLASNASAFCTGHVLIVDGGMSVKI